MDIYANGMYYTSFWFYVKHTKDPLKIGRDISILAIGFLLRPLFHLVVRILREKA